MESSRYNVDHGLRTPNEAFWAWTDNMGRYILGHFGYFWPIYQHPFWYSESTVSLRSCEYSKNNESFNDKIHYITMILYLNYKKNKKTVL